MGSPEEGVWRCEIACLNCQDRKDGSLSRARPKRKAPIGVSFPRRALLRFPGGEVHDA